MNSNIKDETWVSTHGALLFCLVIVVHAIRKSTPTCELGKIHANKYRVGTSDATTSSSLIESLITISFDYFLTSKQP